jgi:hypothetical protein
MVLLIFLEKKETCRTRLSHSMALQAATHIAGSSADLALRYDITHAGLLVPLMWHQLLGDQAGWRRSVSLALSHHPIFLPTFC